MIYDLHALNLPANMPALRYLQIDGVVTTLDAITTLVNLDELEVVGDEISLDFSMLSALSGLEVLRVECTCKELSAISHLTNLVTLELHLEDDFDLALLVGMRSLSSLDLRCSDDHLLSLQTLSELPS